MLVHHEINKIIGNNLKRWMVDRYTIVSLAETTHLSQDTISRIRGGHGCSVDQLIIIARALRRQPEEFFVSSKPSASDEWANLWAVLNLLPSANKKSLGDKIRCARNDSFLTQQKLAEKVGMKRYAINRIESGQRAVTASELWDIAHALEVEIAVLLPSIDGAPGDIYRARRFVANCIADASNNS